MCIAALSVVAALAAAPGSSSLDDKTRAPHFVVPVFAGEVDPLPLERTASDVTVAGVIAEITLTQVWRNRGTRPIEATYVFPTSTRAAVHGVTMRIADRVLHAKIDRKRAARETYERARERGKSAALLEQHRDDVLQMSVANVLPGDVIEVEVRYSELIVPKEHVYSIVVPAVVGPRYVSDTTSDDDAKAFANPTLHDGARVPYRWSSSIRVSSPLDIASIGSSTHAVAPHFVSRGEVTVALDDTSDQEAGARDLVVRYILGGRDIDTGVLLYRDRERGENYFMLLAEPPVKHDEHAMPAREIVFIVDVSGSMRGEPSDIARDTMSALLDSLGERDRFNVLTFAGSSQLYADASVRPTAEHRARALRFVDGSPFGGTELASALDRAFALPRHAEHLSRSFVLLTDGYVAADRQVLRAVRDRLDEANVFVFGIGSSVNRGLLEHIARAGKGEPFYALHRASAASEVARFARLVARPTLTDVTVSFDAFDVYDIEPPRLPDLFADRPIVLFGKYRSGAHGRIVVEGRHGRGTFRKVIDVEDHRELDAHRALRVLWARHRLASLEDFEDETAERVEEATALALEHDLLSRHTSFVVVDEMVRTDEEATPVRQPLPLPDGVTNSAVGGPTGGSGPIGRIDFSDETVMGELVKPEGAYLESRRRPSTSPLIAPRAHFRAEMIESVGGLDGGGGHGRGGVGGGYGSATGVGGLGLRGTGAGGAGRIDLGGRGKSTTRIVPGKVATSSLPRSSGTSTTVQGSLDADVIRRVVVRHLGQLQFCAERERAASGAAVAGRLVLELDIDGSGRVSRAVVVDEGLGSEPVRACVEKAAARMTFPSPEGGGSLRVRYPLVFAAE